MLSSHDIKNEDFLNIYLEDYSRLKQEAEEILKEANLFKQLGDDTSYLACLKKYEVYMLTVETMVVMAAKKPIAEA